MSSQVAIAQAAEDEQAFVAEMNRRHRFLAIPRVLDAPEMHPVDLGECDAEQQIIFLAGDVEVLRTRVKELTGMPGRYQLDRAASRGLFIEWNRTTWVRADVAQPGRLYYNAAGSTVTPSSGIMARTMRAIQSWIKKNSPIRSEDRHPIYVGAHLSRAIGEGRVRLVYPNGSDVTLVPNT